MTNYSRMIRHSAMVTIGNQDRSFDWYLIAHPYDLPFPQNVGPVMSPFALFYGSLCRLHVG